jgi:hypothetical protein
MMRPQGSARGSSPGPDTDPIGLPARADAAVSWRPWRSNHDPRRRPDDPRQHENGGCERSRCRAGSPPRSDPERGPVARRRTGSIAARAAIS